MSFNELENGLKLGLKRPIPQPLNSTHLNLINSHKILIMAGMLPIKTLLTDQSRQTFTFPPYTDIDNRFPLMAFNEAMWSN